jgi:aryl-alcohol dehydrogenase-like predicted oxidoreductase
MAEGATTSPGGRLTLTATGDLSIKRCATSTSFRTMRTARTTLPRSGLEISQVGLGFAHAHTLPSTDRERLVGRALDLGITHIDTARFYGDGFSESSLGRLLAGKRAEVTLSTKFGLLPTALIGAMGTAAAPLRKARSLFKKLGLIKYPQRSYSRATMQASLAASLRALKTDHIDIYFLHEPREDSVIEDDLFEGLEQEKKKGTIRFIGVSGNSIDGAVARFGKYFDVIQSAESSWSNARFVPDITHSLFSGTVAQKGIKPGADTVRPLLEQALARRPGGAVIVQTRSTAHLEQIVAWTAGS